MRVKAPSDSTKLKIYEKWDDQMNGSNLEHLVFIAYTYTISSADVPQSWEVIGEKGIKNIV